MRILWPPYFRFDESLSFTVDVQTVVEDYMSSLYAALRQRASYDFSSIEQGIAECAISISFTQDKIDRLSDHIKKFREQPDFPNFKFVGVDHVPAESSGAYDILGNNILISCPTSVFITEQAFFKYIHDILLGSFASHFDLVVSHELTHYLDYLHWPQRAEIVIKKRIKKFNDYEKHLLQKTKDWAAVQTELYMQYLDLPDEIQAIMQSCIRFIYLSYVNYRIAEEDIMKLLPMIGHYTQLGSTAQKKIIRELYKYLEHKGVL